MARNRMIKPEFWEDEKIGMLSPMARLLFIGALNFADDYGYIRWNETYLGASIFPYDKISDKKIKKLMEELKNLNFLEVFETNFNFFVAKFRNWEKHQKIDKKQESKFIKSLKSETLKNQAEVENDSPNRSPNDSPNDSRANEMKEKEKEKEVNARAKRVVDKSVDNFPATQNENKTKGKENAGVTPPAPTFLNSFPDQNGNSPNDTAKSQTPMSWTEQANYARSLGISCGLTEQIIAIAKVNRLFLTRQHWAVFTGKSIAEIILLLDSLNQAVKQQSPSG